MFLFIVCVALNGDLVQRTCTIFSDSESSALVAWREMRNNKVPKINQSVVGLAYLIQQKDLWVLKKHASNCDALFVCG